MDPGWQSGNTPNPLLGALVSVHQANVAEARTNDLEALALQRKLLGRDHPDIAATPDGLAVVPGVAVVACCSNVRGLSSVIAREVAENHS
jgi:hypothetical protein